MKENEMKEDCNRETNEYCEAHYEFNIFTRELELERGKGSLIINITSC